MQCEHNYLTYFKVTNTHTLHYDIVRYRMNHNVFVLILALKKLITCCHRRIFGNIMNMYKIKVNLIDNPLGQ